MKKQWLSFLLTLVMLLSIATVPANATDAFSDVGSESWCYSYVSTLASQGVTGGYEDGSFKPKNNVTNGAVLKLVLESLYHDELAAYAPTGSGTFSRYTEYAREQGYIDAGYEKNLAAPATRGEVAELIVSCAGWENEKQAASASFADSVSGDVLVLCNRGILCGSMTATGARYFYTDSPITRGAVSAVVYRLRYGLANADILTAANTVKPAQLASVQDYFTALKYMLADGWSVLKITSAQNDWAHCEEYFNDAVELFMCVYPEYYGAWHSFGCGLDGNTMTIRLDYDEGSNYSHITQGLAAAETIREELYAAGTINSAMTDAEKARVYFDYVHENVRYSLNPNATDIYGIYGALVNRSAVCLGYTGALNRFLKLEGISCSAALTEDHIWTIAELDGEKVYLDSTNNFFNYSARQLEAQFGSWQEF